ncbi:MAG: hypothetical protein ACRDLN_03030 [Solirubrobacteraceae bacterium]
MLIDEAELRYQLERRHDSPLARSAALLDVLAELEDRGLLVADGEGWRLAAGGRRRLDAGGRFAVMQDDSVLCAECVHEAAGDPTTAQRPESIVHAWIEPGAGVCCRWCGESTNLDDVGGAEL